MTDFRIQTAADGLKLKSNIRFRRNHAVRDAKQPIRRQLLRKGNSSIEYVRERFAGINTLLKGRKYKILYKVVKNFQ
jgi:hypothetical protein